TGITAKLSRSASTTSRWPLAPRNAIAASHPASDLRQLAEAASWLFATGVQLALPLLALALLIQLAFGIVARTTPGLDMFSVGLGVATLGLMAAWVWAVPLVAHGVGLGLEQLAGWLGRLR
ncbi:MAG TPA: flagellar biosynthetic protein FliR, partial [Thiobacillus sp.]|nr:flagellar biosynthetic protein FliR [Thiobacillus sp.]